MGVQLRPRTITVDRGSRGFGLSLIYRGLDKYEEKDTGIFVARVVPGGQAARYGVRENDKIVTINSKTPRNVDDAVAVIKQAGNQIKLVVLREEEMPDIQVEDSSSIGEADSTWASDALDIMRDTLGQQPISRSGSARSFNTTFGPPGNATPSPRLQRAQGPHATGSFSGGSQVNTPTSPSAVNKQQDFARQQAEYRARQEAAERARQQQLQQYQQQQETARQLARQDGNPVSVKDTVRDMISNSDFSNFDVRPRSNSATRRVIQETKKSTENITRIVETMHRPGTSQSGRYKSTNSLHDLGLDNYPNPEYPEASRLSRKEEKQSLQNLNNRLAGYIDRVRQLQQENAKLVHQVRTVEEYQSKEITNVKDIYDKQINDLKGGLESMNKQYNQLKVGAEGLLSENEDLKERLNKKDRDLLNANNHANALEDEVRELSSRMKKLEQDRQRAQDELKDALPELDVLRKKLADLKRVLDDEQLKKADLENQCARLEEDLKFKLQLLEKELTEVKHRKEIEINEMDGKLQEEYELRLQKALEELRGVYDKQMKQSREDFAKLYDNRIQDLQGQLTKERGANASSSQELKESRGRIEALISKVSDLEGANLALNQKIADLAQDMEDQKAAHRAQMAAKDDEIKRLLDELAHQLKEYQNLQDLKVQLDMEIAVFKSLIESEEDRLGLGDRSLDLSDSSDSHSRTKVEHKKESSSFQRKVTVSQTQL
ncbi:lamin-C-like isoform X2 [Tigriopus californicus]|uniref:lamin-C-like isoform X2 n=1 Tax=Tigriopus californicus TaxID=6832 RepID=UPI0027D9F50A|nr:lamin-C-like isoform X2 [Tigriopus californicus]